MLSNFRYRDSYYVEFSVKFLYALISRKESGSSSTTTTNRLILCLDYHGRF